MAIATLSVIILYFLVRLLIHEKKDITQAQSGKYKIVLGIFWLPFGTAAYWYEVANYVPFSFCAPPMHVAGFLAWIIFLVADCLNQFRMLSKTVETTTSVEIV
ncbi:MAG: hypothetical protein ACW98U_04785 [Candidatus Thorarchaeota archaeon]